MPPLAPPLLAQARHLATIDPTRPQQVNLCRAVSSTYYAIFHHMIEESLAFFLGTTPGRESLRLVLARAFGHGEMASAARAFAGGNLPASIATRMTGVVISVDLRWFAQTFLSLQEARHLADYDHGQRFDRSEVLSLVRRAERATQTVWPAIRDTPAGELFLLSILVWNRIRER